MKYRSLGKSGLKVSEISLGGWLTLGGHVDDALSNRLIHHAFFKGVNLFDVADIYSNGRAEIVLGKALKKLPREQVVVATKVFWSMHEGPFGGGLSKKHIIQACEASLKRMGIDYIDLYQFHLYDPELPLEESLGALDILVRQGKVLYVGFSNYNSDNICEAVELCGKYHYPKFISSQPPYNIFDRGAEKDVFPLCQKNGIGNIVYSPLAHGVLTGKYEKGKPYPKGSRSYKPGSEFMSKYLNTEYLDRVMKIKELAYNIGITPATLSLAWVLRRTEVSSAIVGATSIEQLDENVDASGINLTNEVIDKIEEILL